MSNKICIYPGTFDPVTLGHMDIIRRAAGIFDEVYVGMLINQQKKFYFTQEQRMEMLREATKNIEHVYVESFDGLLIDYANAKGARFVVRGIRNATDYEYEQQMAVINRTLKPDLETVFLTASAGMDVVSSTFVRELIAFDADLSGFVPPCVYEYIKNCRSAQHR